MKYARNSTIIIGSFLILALLIFVISHQVSVVTEEAKSRENIKAKPKISEFLNIKLFTVADDKPVLKLDSQYLNIVENQKMNFVMPNGVVYSDDKESASLPVNFNFSASVGEYSFLQQKLFLKDNVEFSRSKDAQIKAQELVYYAKTSNFEAKDKIFIQSKDQKTQDMFFINSDQASGNLDKRYFHYKGHVSGKLKRQKIYEQGLDFKSNSLKIEFANSVANLEGEVEINRNNINMLAGRAELQLENYNKQLKYYSLYDDIKLQEHLKLKDGTVMVRKAYADRIEGFNQERKMVLTGSPRVIYGSDIIRGYKVTLRENLEMVEVDDSASSFTIKNKKDRK